MFPMPCASGYQNKLAQLEKEFSDLFCDEDGSINWEKLVIFNSGK
jgi:hypothetical protein